VSEEKRLALNLDISKVLDLAHLGARRASAFVTIAKTRTSDPTSLTDFSLGNTHKHSFWPSPVPESIAISALDEFDSWIIGSALRELHSFFEVFLNQTWYLARAVNEHGVALPSNYVLEDRSFRDITSVRKKLEKISEVLPVENYWLTCLTSMHFARNCLSHGAGHVRERDCTDGIELCVTWSGMDVFLLDGDEKVYIGDAITLPYEVKSEDGAKVMAEVVKRERRFEIGQKVTFQNAELAEICTFYTGIAALIIQNLIGFFKAKGVPIMVLDAAQPT
jgi:hypothetical protein